MRLAQGRRRRAQRPLRAAAHARAGGARREPAAATRRAVVERALELRADGLTLAATAEQLRAEFDEADHITKDTLASLLRRQTRTAARSTIARRVSIGARSTTSTRSCTAPSRMRSAGAGWPATRPTPPTRPGWPEVRRRPRVGCGDPAAVPRHSPRRRATGSTRCGCCSPRPACAAARRSACGGATSTSTPAGCASSRRSRRSRSKVTVGEPKTARGRRSISLDDGDGRRAPRSPQGDARGAPARRPRLRRRGPRVPPARRRLPPARRRQRAVRPPGRPVRPADG